MKPLHKIPSQPTQYSVQFGFIVMLLLSVSFLSKVAFAAPPAIVATCEGIKEAYSILGTQCINAYANINHAPANAADRLTSFKARKNVLEIFQKALLCNGMYGATGATQQLFKNGEQGHLTALANLRIAMTNAADPNIPAAYTAADLKSVTINKPQCK